MRGFVFYAFVALAFFWLLQFKDVLTGPGGIFNPNTWF